jgi:hypothetical protein
LRGQEETDVNRTPLFFTGLATLGLVAVVGAQERAPSSVEEIAWFGTLESARREAARSGRPIFLIAARPCRGGVPGFW